MRLDLQGSIDKFRFGEVVDHRRAVLSALAAPGNPANQIISVGRREWQNLYELLTPLVGGQLSFWYGLGLEPYQLTLPA